MKYLTTTKNLFGYSPINVVNDMANGTVIESLPNGAIVQGNPGAEPGSPNYSSGWFRPGSSISPTIKAHLLAGDTVTISCDYLILERNYPSLTDVRIYLNDDTHSLSNVSIPNIEVGKLYRLTATYTVDIEGDYYPVFTINSNKTKVTNIQIEKGSTATPYVPYGYLPMYKGRYKVSNICQLLDKSKYPATQTINGVTFTNNGDGTITVNGTATSTITVLINSINTTTDYRYLLSGCPSGGIDDNGNWIYRLRCFNGIGDEYGNGKIAYANQTGNTPAYLQINYGVTISNLTFKPQLFDLTEMYGAGNEPTTVEEFRQKYPNELYPYSPYCWAKMKSLIYKDDIEYIKMK